MIFPDGLTIEKINSFCKNTLIEHLNINFTDFGEDFISATMPVDHTTHQPVGLLHGGANCALAETLGSMASHLIVKDEGKGAVGLEINANHIKSKREGMVTGTAKPLHIGRKSHVWDIRINDEEGKLLSICRLTVMVIDLK